MKILFFLVVIANVALFIWEYKTGAFVPFTETLEQNAALNREQILLVSELKNIPSARITAPVSETPEADATTDKAEKPSLTPESLTTISEHKGSLDTEW